MSLAWWLFVAAMIAIIFGLPFAYVVSSRRSGERGVRNADARAEQEAARREAIERESARVEAARREMTERIAARQAEMEREAERLGGDERQAAQQVIADIARRAEESARRAEEHLRRLQHRQDG